MGLASLNPSGLRPYKLQGGVAIPRGYSNVTAAITRLPLLMETRENPKPVGRNRFIAPLRADPYANGRFVGSRRKWRNALRLLRPRTRVAVEQQMRPIARAAPGHASRH